MATEKGHQDQHRRNLRSTNNTINDDNEDQLEQEENNSKTHNVFIVLQEVSGKIYSDQTGRFPHTSSRGMKYVMIFYIYDANYVQGIPIKNRSELEFLKAYQSVYDDLKMKGYTPKLQKIDNETLHKIIRFICKNYIHLQFTPPHQHCQNAAERAVCTWKNHFLSGLASLPPNFPMAYWCRLIPQCNITLNLMRACRQNPLLSVHTALHGEFHFDATPMAPPGTETLAQVKPGVREAWGFHSMEAWYVGPAPMHYQCYTVIAKKSGAEHITDTVKFRHHAVALPTVSSAERVTKATNSLIHAIKDMPQPSHPPHIEAIEKLRAILKERLRSNTPNVPISPSEGGTAKPHRQR